MTVLNLAKRLDRKADSIYAALRNMPDSYIGSWTEAQHQAPAEAVWRAVVPPEDCPKPRPKKPNARPAELRLMEPRNLSEIRFGFVLTNASPTGRH
jgi:hypothetical protein